MKLIRDKLFGRLLDYLIWAGKSQKACDTFQLTVRCLLAMLSSTGQLSIYAPRSDPTSQQWDEVSFSPYYQNQADGRLPI
jgi:hypothetical protein